MTAASPSVGAPLPADEAARRRIREALDESQLVEAAAGTGKTTVLVERLVAILEEGRGSVDGLAAVTFTRKAAGELKLRLRQALDARLIELRGSGAAGERPANLETAISRLEQAAIGTIHSLCADILRERPVEAGVDPGFGELAEDEAPRLFARTFGRWIEEQLEAMPPGLRRELARLTVGPWSPQHSALDRLREAAWRLVDWRDFAAPWRRPEFDRETELEELSAGVERLGELVLCGRQGDVLRRNLEPVVELSNWIVRTRQLGVAGPGPNGGDRADGREAFQDQLEARLVKLLRDLSGFRSPRKGRGGFAEGVAREQVFELWRRLSDRLGRFEQTANGDLAALLKDELSGAVQRYEHAKRLLGKLDFHDLLMKARDLLRCDREVRRHLQARYRHLFIDEFQDTDPLQAEILLLLSADDPDEDDWRQVRPAPGKLFVVGDPKQSIYRFRRADVVLYQDVKEMLAERGVEVLQLTTSFRSVAPIQRLVNAAFAPCMTGDRTAGSADYIPLSEHRQAIPGQPQVVVLPPPKPYGYRNVTQRDIEACQPSATVEFVRWLIQDSGWKVEVPDPDNPGHFMRTPVQARHICLLFRRFLSWNQDTARDYVRGLEALGIPHLLIGARSFHDREEVEALRSALTAVEWPDDRLSVYATLRGSLFAFDDDLLLRFKTRYGNWHPLFSPRKARECGEPPEEFASLVDVLDFLGTLHRRRNYRPIVQTVQEILAKPRAQAAMALRPAGNQVLGNAQRVCDLARRYEVAGGRSFRGFVEQLDEEAERIGGTQAPVVEEDAEGVRVMTVHTAKGLEFPVVILADMTAKLSRGAERTVRSGDELCAMKLLGLSPQELLDASEVEDKREEAEGVRVAYVAATRARDLLVAPAVGDVKRPGWIECLNDAVYPGSDAWRGSAPAEGCPEFGDRSVAVRPSDYDRMPEQSVRPGRYRFPKAAATHGAADDAPDYDVVWWDADLLNQEPPATYGLLGEDLLVEGGGAAADASRERFERWRSRNQALLASGGRPSVRPEPVTGLDFEPPGPAAEVVVEELERVRDRPGGLRFGSLVHTVLRDAPLAGEPDRIRELARLHGSLLAADAAEIEAAVAAVSAALQSPAARAARDSRRVLRETPFVLPLPASEGGSEDGEDGRGIVEGTVDLAYLDKDGRWIVVDWKTDLGDLDAPAGAGDGAAEGPTRGEAYRRQVRWYCYALEQLTGAPASGRLVLL